MNSNLLYTAPLAPKPLDENVDLRINRLQIMLDNLLSEGSEALKKNYKSLKIKDTQQPPSPKINNENIDWDYFEEEDFFNNNNLNNMNKKENVETREDLKKKKKIELNNLKLKNKFGNLSVKLNKEGISAFYALYKGTREVLLNPLLLILELQFTALFIAVTSVWSVISLGLTFLITICSELRGEDSNQKISLSKNKKLTSLSKNLIDNVFGIKLELKSETKNKEFRKNNENETFSSDLNKHTFKEDENFKFKHGFFNNKITCMEDTVLENLPSNTIHYNKKNK
ncbi:hypothetical protein HK099_003365, partial [Clydaea vesicula]